MLQYSCSRCNKNGCCSSLTRSCFKSSSGLVAQASIADHKRVEQLVVLAFHQRPSHMDKPSRLARLMWGSRDLVAPETLNHILKRRHDVARISGNLHRLILPAIPRHCLVCASGLKQAHADLCVDELRKVLSGEGIPKKPLWQHKATKAEWANGRVQIRLRHVHALYPHCTQTCY